MSDAERAAEIANQATKLYMEGSAEDHLREVAKALGHHDAVVKVYGGRLDEIDPAEKLRLGGETEMNMRRGQLHGLLAIGKLLSER